MTTNGERFAEAMAALNGKSVEIGWFAENKYPDGQPVAGVMSMFEHGTATQPARPLLRTVFKENEEYLRSMTPKFAKAVMEGRVTPEEPLKDVGEYLVAKISEKLQNNGFERNAISTIKKKGFDKPGVDSGHAGQSVQAKVS